MQSLINNEFEPILNAGTLSFEEKEIFVNEEETAVSIGVIRTNGSEGSASVDFATIKGSARRSDFKPLTGTLFFAPGETRKDIIIRIEDDFQPEERESFDISLDLATGATLGVPRTAIVTILDDDALSQNSVAFSEPKINVNETDGSISVEVIRIGNSSQPVFVDYTSSDGTAKSDYDYLSTSGTLVFNPGETSKIITLQIQEDEFAEPVENIVLSLSNSQGIDLGVIDTTNIIITDNDESPDQFKEEIIASGINQLTSFEWLSSETILLAQKDGIVQVLNDGELLSQPFIDISDQVNSTGERGLMGLAVHPDFPAQPYVYLSFSYDPPETSSYTGAAGPDGDGARVSRVVRVTADPSTNYTTALPNSEVILLGKNSTWENIGDPFIVKQRDVFPPLSCDGIEDCLPSEARIHAIGTLEFGNDGSLFVGVGDAGFAGRIDPQSIRAQDIDILAGKLLRIDPLTGEGYSDNPFYDGNPNSNRSKVYNYGLRNPFRFTFHPSSNEIFIGDVGWARWEEINTGRGKNFGWPYYEGGIGSNLRTNGYSSLPEAQAFYDSGQTVTPPIHGLSHDLGASAIIVGDFYTETAYPEIYQNALFYSDFNLIEAQTTVNALIFDEVGNVITAIDFPVVSQPGIVQMSTGPDGNVYFANFFTDEFGRWVLESETDEIKDIIGTSDNDVLIGTFNNERIYGLLGNDLIEGKGGADIILGGKGADTISYISSPERVIINLTTESAAGGDAQGDTFSSIERIIGSNFPDRLIGNNQDNLIESKGGADTLLGKAGIDTISYISSPERVIINLANQTAAGGDAEGDVFSGFENIIGSNFSDILIGDDGQNRLNGGDGDDTLIGVDISSPESLLGQGERDILIGSRQFNNIDNDTFVLGNEDDVFYNDRDSATIGKADLARILDFNSLNDKIQLHGSADLYRLRFSFVEGRTDATLIYLPEIERVGEVIARIIDVSPNLSLDDSAFIFV